MSVHEAAVQKIVDHVGQYVKPVEIRKVTGVTPRINLKNLRVGLAQQIANWAKPSSPDQIIMGHEVRAHLAQQCGSILQVQNPEGMTFMGVKVVVDPAIPHDHIVIVGGQRRVGNVYMLGFKVDGL